jgi:hypothetical protein
MDDRSAADFEIDRLMHPAQTFGHPREVVADRALTLDEKRAILASWASDACAVEAAPALRRSRNGPVVPFDDIMDALRALDAVAASADAGERPSRRRRPGGKSRGESGDQGAPLH